jgi:hypothetical protein
VKIATRPTPALLLFGLLACEPDSHAADAEAGASEEERSEQGPGAAAPLHSSDPVVARWAAGLPDSLLHRAGACPFECCVYRTWTPTGEVPLREQPLRSLPVFHRIPAGQPFQADSGFVRMTGISVLAVADSVDAEAATFGRGDTLVVLDYVGEGRWNVWDGRRVQEVSGFWGAEIANPKAELIGGAEYAREWWVYATTRDGVRGWLDADSVPRLAGADACGG